MLSRRLKAFPVLSFSVFLEVQIDIWIALLLSGHIGPFLLFNRNSSSRGAAVESHFRRNKS